MKKIARVSGALLLVLSIAFALFASYGPRAFAANEPTFKYDGSWNDAKNELTLHGKVDNPSNKFYSGAVCLDYDKSLFELVETDNPEFKDKFTKIKNETKDDTDPNKGHVITDFAYFDSTGGLAPSSTPTDAYDLKFKLKNGKKQQDVKSDSIKFSDSTFLNSLEDPYKSDGPVVLYCSKDSSNDERTKFSSGDSAANKANKTISYPLSKPVTGVTVTPETSSIPAGKTVQLTATVAPSDASEKGVTWSSNDPSIATVDANGLVTGKKPGKAIITATTKDGSYTDTAEVTVTEKVIEKIYDSNVTTEAGTAPTLPTTVKVKYSDGTEGEVPVTWEAVSPNSYATAGNFEVKGSVAGITDKAVCKVKVTSKATPNNNTNNNGTNNNGTNNSGTNNNGSNGNAQTGDNVRALVIMSVLLVISVTVVISIIISRKKKSKKIE